MPQNSAQSPQNILGGSCHFRPTLHLTQYEEVRRTQPMGGVHIYIEDLVNKQLKSEMCTNLSTMQRGQMKAHSWSV